MIAFDPNAPTFLFADARHSTDAPSCRKCVQGYPLACARPGCTGRIHAALVRIDSAAYLITLCEQCLSPEPEVELPFDAGADRRSVLVTQ